LNLLFPMVVFDHFQIHILNIMRNDKRTSHPVVKKKDGKNTLSHSH
jgi:hypothetical protein